MKNITTHIIIVLFIFLSIFLMYNKNTHAASLYKDPTEIFQYYENSINNHDIYNYIELFARPIQEEMLNYCKFSEEKDFFIEDKIKIISYDLNKDYYDYSLSLQYNETLFYDVELEITYNQTSRETCRLIPGYNKTLFSFVKENNQWKIYCISDRNEQDRGNMSLTCPSATVIYFTKPDNLAHWNVTTKNLPWNDYLKNVLHEEWYISLYNNSSYAFASSMASKMYAWYYTIHPKWNFSPYYACMKDNSQDQNYLYSSYNSLSQFYKTAIDNALSTISNQAMTTSNGTLFEVHYDADSHLAHTGYMCASECYTKAQDGCTAFEILSYYYSYSPYNSGQIQIGTY